MDNAYDVFAEFYDEYIAHSVPLLHRKYLNLTKVILEKFKPRPGRILDATCGTGILMRLLQTEGFDVEGMDLSPAMLNKAREKGLAVHQGDLRHFDLGQGYDLILCFDSLGHLTTGRDLSAAMQAIGRHLNPGGLFLCDGGTRAKASRMIGQEFTYDSEPYSFVWRNSRQDDDLIGVEMVITEKQSGREYLAQYRLRGHDIEDMVAALEGTGMRVVFATLEPMVKKNGSFVFCCRKEG